jgi:glucuronosyltransferase
MGSNKSKDMPDILKTSLLKVFGELKQTVLWKFEENLPNLPKNVHIVQWAPQPSILSKG